MPGTSKIADMPSDLTPTAETEMIKAYVRVLAPAIHDVDCGTRLDGGYDLWFKLNPSSTIKQVVISRAEYRDDHWKDKVGEALEEINV